MNSRTFRRACVACQSPFDAPTSTRKHCQSCWQTCRVFGNRVNVKVAYTTMRKAIKDGLLRPAKEFLCVDCKLPARDYDHRDYLLPLIVEPTCRRCNLARGPGANPGEFPAPSQEAAA